MAELLTVAIPGIMYVLSLSFVGPWMHSGDWPKVISLLSILLLIILFGVFSRSKSQQSKSILLIEIAALIFFLGYILYTKLTPALFNLYSTLNTDMGTSTISSVVGFYRQGMNPYTSAQCYGYGLGAGFKGYKYGPGILLAYFPILFFQLNQGFRLVNLFFISLICFLSIVLIHGQYKSILLKIRAALVILTGVLLLDVLWAESLMQGAVDVVPVGLALAGFWFYRQTRLLWAGVFFGFSVSCKPCIGLVFILVLLFHLRGEVLKRFMTGLLLGSSPWIPFLIQDPKALIRNTVVFHLIKGATRRAPLFNFQGVSSYLGIALLFAIIYYCLLTPLKGVHWISILLRSSVLLVAAMVTFLQIYNDHSLWILTLTPLVLLAALESRTKENFVPVKSGDLVDQD